MKHVTYTPLGSPLLGVGRFTLVAAIVAMACGCVSFPTADVPVSLPELYSRRVDPFIIHSNFPVDEGDPIEQELLGLRQRVQGTLELELAARPIEVYIFNDRPVYERYMRANYPDLPPRRAFFIAQGPRLMVYAFRDNKLAEDLRHETAHALLHAAIGTVPLWLDEGLAEYFEAPPSPAQLHARHHSDIQAWTQQGWHPALTRLEGLTEVRQMNGRDYGEAWGWVYFMLHSSTETRDTLLGYLRDLSQGEAREPLSARLFPTVNRPDVQMVAFLDGAGS